MYIGFAAVVFSAISGFLGILAYIMRTLLSRSQDMEKYGLIFAHHRVWGRSWSLCFVS